MIKKLISVAAGAGLVLTMTGTVFARGGWHHSSSKIEVENENTDVRTFGVNVANSGLNRAYNGGEVEHTGDASATLEVGNTVNYAEVGRCALCSRRGVNIEVENEDTDVRTFGVNAANSGLNRAYNGGEVEHTGNASARMVVVNDVNFVVVAPTPVPAE